MSRASMRSVSRRPRRFRSFVSRLARLPAGAGRIRSIALLIAIGILGSWALFAVDRTPEDVVTIIGRFIERERIPGAVVAFGIAGEPPALRSLGLADAAKGVTMTDDLRFRMASLSKPITAAAVMSLVHDGKIALEDRLADIVPGVSEAVDPRYGQITVRHLLQHTAGWNRGAAFDPLMEPERLGGRPARDGSCGAIAHQMLRRPLDTSPGAAQSYSNVGYCWL